MINALQSRHIAGHIQNPIQVASLIVRVAGVDQDGFAFRGYQQIGRSPFHVNEVDVQRSRFLIAMNFADRKYEAGKQTDKDTESQVRHGGYFLKRAFTERSGCPTTFLWSVRAHEAFVLRIYPRGRLGAVLFEGDKFDLTTGLIWFSKCDRCCTELNASRFPAGKSSAVALSAVTRQSASEIREELSGCRVG